MKLRIITLVGATALVGLGCTESHGDEDAGGIVFDATFPDAGTDAGPPESTVGDSCRGDMDCDGEGASCLTDFPGGYCTSLCDGEECAAGATCIVVDRMGTSLCLDSCDPGASDDECRAGYGCATEAGFVCLPGCEDDDDCEIGVCDPNGGFNGEGSCYDPDAEAGDACAQDEECPSGNFCLDLPGGYCASFGCDVESNTGCGAGTQCLPRGRRFGACFLGCVEDSECRDGYECQDSATHPGRTTCQPEFNAANLGTICSADRGDCTGGACLTEGDSGFPDSYCVAIGCEVGAATSDCPGDGVCVASTTGGGLCLDGCAAAGDCRDGYDCKPSDSSDPSSPTACLPGCDDASVCGNEGFACNLGTGLCTEPFVEAALGEPCASAEDCTGGRCVSEEADGWPAGTCTYPGCSLTGAGGAVCPAASTCVDDESGNPDLGVCVDACTVGGTTCRPGYACVELTAGGTEGACRPACEDGDCSGGRTCNATSGLCEAP